jgi:predicted transcriptional regulator
MAQGDIESSTIGGADLMRMTTQIVSSYVSKNPLPPEQLPELINAIHNSLKNVDTAPVQQPEQPLKPAVPIKKSVHPDYIICLEDGKKLKMLKRYLRTTYGMSPDEYRAKWGLPADYPMVAPNYAEQRSQFAKRIGLGRSSRGGGRRRAS